MRLPLLLVCLGLPAAGCQARPGQAECHEGASAMDLEEASTEIGVDPALARSELLLITALEWALSEGMTADVAWSISSPSAVSIPDALAHCEPTPLILSDAELTLSIPEVLAATLKGQVEYLAEGASLRLDGDVADANGGLDALLAQSGYRPADYALFTLWLDGSADGGRLALDGNATTTSGSEELLAGDWVPGRE